MQHKTYISQAKSPALLLTNTGEMGRMKNDFYRFYAHLRIELNRETTDILGGRNYERTL